MKFYLLLFFASCAVLLNAQSTHLVSEFSKTGFEDYEVLDSDTTIRHGSYKKLNTSGQVMEEGIYKMGLKDSVWNTYSSDGKLKAQATYNRDSLNGKYTEYTTGGQVRATGTYKANKFTGVWKIYDASGNFEQEYDFTKNVLVKVDSMSGYATMFEGAFDPDTLEHSTHLFYKGGDWAFKKILANVKYPPMERDNDISGKVFVKVAVNEDGACSDIKIERGVSPGLDKEAKRVIELTCGNWVAPTVYGKKIKSDFVIPIIFRLQ